MSPRVRLELLYERPGLPRVGLPADLAEAYGGDLGFSAPRLFANFVSSVDGVVALRDRGESGHVISGDSEADRFVMGLLRACADAVLVGAGTFRKTPGALWRAEAIYPPAASQFAELRKRLGLRQHPPLAIVTASGELGGAGAALDDALLFTTPDGATTLRGRLPAGARVHALDAGPIRLDRVLDALRAEGLPRVLTEGGPSLVGQIVAQGLLDELFVTSAPSLFGRADGDGRKSLLDGVDLAPAGASLDLASARRHGSHLFLRYMISRTTR